MSDPNAPAHVDVGEARLWNIFCAPDQPERLTATPLSWAKKNKFVVTNALKVERRDIFFCALIVTPTAFPYVQEIAKQRSVVAWLWRTDVAFDAEVEQVMPAIYGEPLTTSLDAAWDKAQVGRGPTPVTLMCQRIAQLVDGVS